MAPGLELKGLEVLPWGASVGPRLAEVMGQPQHRPLCTEAPCDTTELTSPRPTDLRGQGSQHGGLRATCFPESEMGLVTISCFRFSEHKTCSNYTREVSENTEQGRSSFVSSGELARLLGLTLRKKTQVTNVTSCCRCRSTTTLDTWMKSPGTTCPCAF